ncbi:MAG: PHB depolymerase family esterase [Hoeflea sp.]|nr:PHB depolymerase family esterase [Hoeflea sp.]
MTRTLAASMRRMNRLMRPARLSKATRSFHKAMTDILVKSALGPVADSKARTAKPRKATAPQTGRGPAVRKKPGTARSAAPGEGRATPRVAAAAQFLDRTHRSAAGARSYKLYLPAGTPRPTGLVLMLHGCKQSPDDFATGTGMNALAEKHGLAIAYPAQTRGHNAAACWNWFRPGNQRRGAGEPAILASLTRKLTREFNLERDRVFVAGLSAGGAMAVILADAYPDVFSAAGVHSGLARGAARNVISAMTAMRRGGVSEGARPASPPSPCVRRIIFQGTADSTVHPANASQIVANVVGGDAAPARISTRSAGGRGYARSDFTGSDGTVLVELWIVEGAGHAWSGGHAAGSYADSKGPNASAEMIRFFLTKNA